MVTERRLGLGVVCGDDWRAGSTSTHDAVLTIMESK